jgi:serine/threonine protein kinase
MMSSSSNADADDCPAHDVLAQVAVGTGTSQVAEIVHRHLSCCDECRKRYEAIRRALGNAGPTTTAPIGGSTPANPPAADGDGLAATADFSGLGMVWLEGVPLPGPRDDRYRARLGNYDVIHVIGKGGCGFVLKGYDETLRRHVALKLMHPDLNRDEKARQRFVREARAAARLSHPQVVTIYSVCTDGDFPFIVMEYVDGLTLESLLRKKNRFELDEASDVARRILSALDHAHSHGVVHRDVKPGNTLVRETDGTLKLTDFGLARILDDTARLTNTGGISGTPAYMSPEQVRGESDVDGRSDLFSVGVMLYEMLTGVQPFQGTNSLNVMYNVCNQPHPDPRLHCPSLPDEMAGVLNRALEKDRRKRFATAGEFIDALGGKTETPGGDTRPNFDVSQLLTLTHEAPVLRARVWTHQGLVGSTRDLVAVSTQSRMTYRIGDIFTLAVQADRDCYLTLFDIGTSGAVWLLLADYAIAAGQPVRLCGPDETVEWYVNGPPGAERLKGFFSLRPLACGSAAGSSARSVRPVPVTDVNSMAEDIRLALEQMPKEAWADALCEFLVQTGSE